MKVVSTNIGERKEIDWKGKSITTGIFKFTIDEPIFLDIEDVRGDAVCDRVHHGGIEQAVYAYSEKHYAYWKEFYPDLDWRYGMFGENLTIDDLDESKIHVGDTYKVGEVIIEVTKPRQPCMKLGVRFNNMKIVKQFWKQDFPGIYFKILETGKVKSGDEFEQIKSCPENPTIAEVYQQKRVTKGM
ncbi:MULTISPECIES: MOSC domain-containing protein [unclassified Tenacibaculum]|uniref:MOSC domain-containing protein n=1 Tax=unclassified Tenacibaculum TaxID=2635139 RepID=UPI001F16C2FB|nr:MULTISPECIES: MOSC domain-containing protein [unclassified Tenacibaculum]MCF2874482.1 MOSC domain-containing protein [Tenacibaculum sp. Cn5-1]MCF2934452.1 MOSC domain-containing protein [Tenacibaculum sp. Cn5-34]MCG7510662.1 MOSC domain-containing protein [Tenacibaculum sp. Cn5-46]